MRDAQNYAGVWQREIGSIGSTIIILVAIRRYKWAIKSLAILALSKIPVAKRRDARSESTACYLAAARAARENEKKRGEQCLRGFPKLNEIRTKARKYIGLLKG